MPMQIHGLDSDRRYFTKKIRGIDLTPAGVTAVPNTILFRPPYGVEFLLKAATLKVYDTIAGTVSAAPNITIDTGTATENYVAAVNGPSTAGTVKQLTLATLALTQVITNAKYIRLLANSGATGGTKFEVMLILELLLLSN